MENAKIIELVKKISEERNEIAFSEIFDFIAPKINAYYLKNNLSNEQAEELTQEVLSTIWIKAKLFDPEKSKFITWSFTIARNKKIDFYRKNKKNDVNEEDIRDFLYENNKNLKVVLSGTRRNYVIRKLNEMSIPFVYFEMASLETMNKLYNILDLYLVTSRVEGGPQAIMECALTKTPILSTNVGIASEILHKNSIFKVSEFKEAKVNTEYSFQRVQNYIIPNGFENFIKLLKRIYEKN